MVRVAMALLGEKPRAEVFSRLFTTVIVFAVGSAFGSAGTAGAQAWVREDPTAFRTAEACGECHVSEFAVWRKTPHSTGFKTLHREESAEAIAGKLGFPLVKRDSLCIGCHYTPKLDDGELRAVSGVSCESCHGPGRDWIDVHNDYGGQGLDHRSESTEHRLARIEASRKAGMRRPSDLYELASTCYGCHTVPQEQLVNVGGHSTGSGNFELVEWSQGVIRHNFLQSFLDGGGTENVESSLERKRVMYVVGRALELEHALRGVAAAKEQGVYLKAMIRRVRVALSEIRAISARTEIPQLDSMVAGARAVNVSLGNRDMLMSTADSVGAAARAFLAGNPAGDRLAAVDPLMLGIADDFEVPDEASGAVVAAEEVRSSSSGPDVDPTSSPAGRGSVSQAAVDSGQTGIPAIGERKRRIRPQRSAQNTLGPGACSKCHTEANQWWYEDGHFRSADPFFARESENVRIASLYGVKPSALARGDAVCMDCHGSVVSGRESRDVNDGVGCEGCHGAASGYLEPHEEGDKSLGVERPGYTRALELGMIELRNLAVRAEVCSGCHYITDERLISSGHPSGAGFDYVAAMAKTKHWQHELAPRAALQAAFSRVVKTRGPVPSVQLARLAGAPSGVSAPNSVASAGTDSSRGAGVRGTSPTRNAPRPFRGALTTSGSRGNGANGAALSPATLDLPPLLDFEPGSSVEDSLRSIKQRLELIYRMIKEQGS